MIYKMLWIGFTSLPLDGFRNYQPQFLHLIVNQLDTAWRFILNEFTTAKSICCPKTVPNTIYLAKERAEGKHYNVAVSHVAKNLCESFTSWKKPTTLNKCFLNANPYLTFSEHLHDILFVMQFLRSIYLKCFSAIHSKLLCFCLDF